MRKKSTTRRDAILQAAFTAICKRGYYETKMDDVARQAGVAKGTVYLYFKDKADLYVGIVVWLIGQARAMIKEVARTEQSPSAKIQRVFSSWLEQLVSHPAAISLVFPELSYDRCAFTNRFREKVLPEVKRLIDDIAALIREGIRQGEFRAVEPRLAAFSFLSAFRAALISAEHHPGGKSAPQRALDIFFYGIRRSV